jgi:glutathione S-transferase
MRLHINPASQHSRRAAMVVHELGLDVELVIVDFMKGEHKSPAYLAHNPNGKVPTLEDGDFWLWESNAIMAYLADSKPGQTLYPTDARGRADVNRWLFWESAHWGPACIHLTWERVMKPMVLKQEAEPALVKAGEVNLARFGAVLDAQLAGKEYVTGRLSIADFAIASMLMYAKHAQMDLSSFANVRAWFARIEARDAWKKTQGPF